MIELVLICLVLFALIWWLRSRRQTSQEKQTSDEDMPPMRLDEIQPRTPSSNDRMHRIEFSANRPEGDWVNWKVASGWFEVAGSSYRFEDAKEFLLKAQRRDHTRQPYGVKLIRDPANDHDTNAIRVVGVIGPLACPYRVVRFES